MPRYEEVCTRTSNSWFVFSVRVSVCLPLFIMFSSLLCSVHKTHDTKQTFQ